MPVVFIDTNIYLDFYRQRINNYRTLLQSLQNLKPFLLITRTTAFEFERNKLDVYMSQNKIEPLRRFRLLGVFPYYDAAAGDSLNKEVRQLEQKVNEDAKDLFSRLQEAHQRNIEAIHRNEDEISRAFNSLGERPLTETPEQLERARERKERGQPPGKRNDVLGDQISWEQLLDAAINAGTVWIVSRDGDYTFAKDDQTRSLLPTLYRELMAVSGVATIRCYGELTSFFRDFNASGMVPSENLPNENTLKEAEVEIRESIRQDDLVRFATPTVPGQFAQWPPICEKSSDGRHHVPGASARPSARYGGWTFHGPCELCGAFVDTGEPYPD